MATGILQRIEDLANSQAPIYTTVKLRPRGTQKFIDTSLKGVVRNAKKVGNDLPTLAADNTTTLANDVSANSTAIQISTVIQNFTYANVLLQIGSLETAQMSNINTSTGQITLQEPLLVDHSAGELVTLYGLPITCVAPAQGTQSGSTQVTIISNFYISNGDKLIVLSIPNTPSSATSYKIIDSSALNTSFPITYALTLDQGITRTLYDADEVFIKAQAAYFSEIVPTANLRDIGPYLIDYVSGTLNSVPRPDETLCVKFYTSLNTPIGPADTTINLNTIDKNYLVLNTIINRESMLFWDIVDGQVQFVDSLFGAVTDDNGHFCISTELVPSFTPGCEWSIQVLSPGPGLLRVMFEPNGYQDFTIQTGSQKVTVGVYLAKPAVLTSLQGPFNVTGLTFSLNVNNVVQTVTFTGTNPLDVSTVVSQLGVLTEVVPSVSLTGQLVLTTIGTGSDQTLVASGTSLSALGFISGQTAKGQDEEQPATRLEVVVKTTAPNQTVKFNNWQPTGRPVTGIAYSITADAVGDSNWQATSLMVKPYFRTRQPLVSTVESRLNAGYILG
jgi:hypothetical protein